jgi:hypothetical protein
MKILITYILISLIFVSCRQKVIVNDKDYSFYSDIKSSNINSFSYRKYFNHYNLKDIDTIVKHLNILKQHKFPIDTFLMKLSNSILKKDSIIRDINYFSYLFEVADGLTKYSSKNDTNIIYANLQNLGFEILSEMTYSMEFNINRGYINKNSKEFKFL